MSIVAHLPTPSQGPASTPEAGRSPASTPLGAMRLPRGIIATHGLPMPSLTELLAEARDERTAMLGLLVLLGLAMVRLAVPGEPRRTVGASLFFAAHLGLLVVAAGLRASGGPLYREARVAALLLAALSLIGLCGSILYSVVL